jgi:hypothetical protein
LSFFIKYNKYSWYIEIATFHLAVHQRKTSRTAAVDGYLFLERGCNVQWIARSRLQAQTMNTDMYTYMFA